MSVLVVGLALVALLVVLAGSFVALLVLWRASVDQWRRIPAERRPRAIAAGGVTVAAIGLAGALAILSPWGPGSFGWVLLVGFGGLMLAVLIAVAIEAVWESRRHRAAASSGNRRSPSGQRPFDRRGE